MALSKEAQKIANAFKEQINAFKEGVDTCGKGLISHEEKILTLSNEIALIHKREVQYQKDINELKNIVKQQSEMLQIVKEALLADALNELRKERKGSWNN